MTHRVHALVMGLLCLIPPAAASGQASPPRLTLTRDLLIGGNAQNLVPISWMVVGADGTIAVPQVQDFAMRVFGPDGRLRATFGRKGQGPGEFAAIVSGGWIGNRLWIYDGANARVVIYTSDGQLLSSTSRTGVRYTAADSARWDRLVPGAAFGLFADSSMLVRVSVQKGAGPVESAVMRVNRTGLVERVIAVMPPPVGTASVVGVPSLAFPFTVSTASALASDGSVIAIATPIMAGPDYPSIVMTVIRSNGDTVYTKRLPFTPVPIPARVVDSTVDALAGQIGRPDVAAAARTQIKATAPTAYSPLRGMVVGRDGVVWLALRSVAAGVPWLVFDARGNIIGQAMVPENVRILAADRMTAWGTEADSDDVESLVRYRVQSGR